MSTNQSRAISRRSGCASSLTYIKGQFAITQHFQSLDADNSGVLEYYEFMDALNLFNLGDCVTPDVVGLAQEWSTLPGRPSDWSTLYD